MDGRSFCVMVVAILDRVGTVESPPYRPELNLIKNDTHPKMELIMRSCWAEQPNDRPSFDEISKILRNINQGK
jgi:hypothetical protein